MDVILIRLLEGGFTVLIAFGVGKLLQKRTDTDSAMLGAIVTGNLLFIISDAIFDALL